MVSRPLPSRSFSGFAFRNTTFMPFHFKEGPANMLTIDALDPIAKIPEYKVCAANIGSV